MDIERLHESEESLRRQIDVLRAESGSMHDLEAELLQQRRKCEHLETSCSRLEQQCKDLEAIQVVMAYIVMASSSSAKVSKPSR